MPIHAFENIPPRNWPVHHDLLDDSSNRSKPPLLDAKILPTQDDLPYLEDDFQNYSLPLPTQDDLPCSDGVPMETERHRKQMEILIDALEPWLGEHGYVSGNMFVYFSLKQLKNQDFRGPDVFVSLGRSNRERKSWVVWEEGKSLDVVIELLSQSTADEDKDTKKDIYQDQLKVKEYFWFDPYNPDDWKGFRLSRKVYKEIPFKNESFVCKQLGLKLTRWSGVYKNVDTMWLRWATLDGELLLLPDEAAEQRAKAETQRADAAEQQIEAEAQRANIAEQRAERLARLLREQGIDPD